MTDWDLLNWQAMLIELAVGGALAYVFFRKQDNFTKDKEKLAKRRRDTASQEIVSTLTRAWHSCENIIGNCKINSFKDELDKGFPSEGFLALLIKQHKEEFHNYIQQIRTLVITSSDVLEPPELTQKILSFCNMIENRVSTKLLMHFAERWSVAVDDIEMFVKENFPSLYVKTSFDKTIYDQIIKEEKEKKQ